MQTSSKLNLYRWQPGEGPHADALARMHAFAKRPSEAMGEAWFMGEQRKMFDYLLERDLADLSWAELTEPVDEITSGTACFGPMREWQEWFHYLLPRLLSLSIEHRKSWVQQMLFSALVTQYPDGIGFSPYEGFREDLLNSLGRAVMSPMIWKAERTIAGGELFQAPLPGNPWSCWWNVSGDICAALFLCLKYLAPMEIDLWGRSVLTIEDPHWRSQLMVWLSRSEGLLGRPGLQPGSGDDVQQPLGWIGSEWLKGNYTGDFSDSAERTPFISDGNKAAFRRIAKELLTPEVLDEWQASIGTINYLAAEHCYTAADVHNAMNRW